MTWLREPDTEPIPGYRLIEPLGTGGFGEVWRCIAPGGIHKAIKFVYGNLNTVDSDSAKAEQEYKAIERIKTVRHPFVLSMDQIQIVGGELVIVMELADKSLFDLLEEYQKEGRPGIPRDLLLGFMADAAEGLDHLIEKHNLQHLDVKPKNLFLISDRVKVADFGLVSTIERSSSAGMMAGITPVYTSPETFQSKISKQSDQYSLAIVYTELLTGQRPFNGKNIRQLAIQHMTAEPDLTLLPECDRPVVHKALAKNPDERYPTCMAFVRALIANAMVDPSTSNSLYGTSTGLRHMVATQAEIAISTPGPRSGLVVTPQPFGSLPSVVPPRVDATPAPLPSPVTQTSAPKAPAPAPPAAKPPAMSVFGQSALVNPKSAAESRLNVPAPPLTNGPGRGVPPPTPKSTTSRPSLPGLAPSRSAISGTGSREAPASGVLRPVLLIGVGSFGRKALSIIRARLLDRLGDLSRVPCFRFLLLETDGDKPKKADAARGDDADLGDDAVLQIPLQSPNTYRRKQMDQVLEWLPKEKVYSIPRSLTVDGHRSLGRLAFCDHSLRIMTRLRNELQSVTNSDAIGTSVDSTRLALLTRSPSVYVFASASGGTGGMLVDLGYTIRRVCERGGVGDATVLSFLFAGSPQDPSTPSAEQANILATLVELNHYSDESTSFTALYSGQDGPKIEESGAPYTASYLLTMSERTKESFDDCLANLAGYITHDLTSPLGASLEKIRKVMPSNGRSPFRQFGTFGLWYPRGLVVRTASRQLCAEIVRGWANPKPPQFPAEVAQLLDRIHANPQLTPGAIRAAIDVEASRGKRESVPTQIVNGWLSQILEECENTNVTGNDPVAWAKAVLEQTAEYIGLEPTDDTVGKFRRGKFSKALDRGVRKTAEQWGNEFVELVRPLSELPGVGLASCELALQQLSAGCQSTSLQLEAKLKELAARRTAMLAALQQAAGGVDAKASSLAWFGPRTSKVQRAFAERLKAFVELRIDEDLTFATLRFYHKVAERLHSRLQDIGFCRQQLQELYRELASPYATGQDSSGKQLTDDGAMMQTTLQMTNTIRVVLPNGEDRLDRCAYDVLHAVRPEDRMRLEYQLHKSLLEPRGGLMEVCRTVTNLAKHLAPPILDNTTRFLEELVPPEDVTAIESAAHRGRPDGFVRRVEGYVKAAAVHTVGPTAEAKLFITIPDSATGRQYGEAVRSTYPGTQPLIIPKRQTDLLFCREQDWLRQTDLRDLIGNCWDSYAEACTSVENSPHIRFDVPQWLPLIDDPAQRW